MRIKCPFCGERALTEYTYSGDADFTRPNASAPDAQLQFSEAVYLRDNPAGAHDELWCHVFGCRSWLRITRDTRTHFILTVCFANKMICT